MKSCKVYYGESYLVVQYMYSPEHITKSSDLGLTLPKAGRPEPVSAELLSFVCDNIVTGWGNVVDIDGKSVEFDRALLPVVFSAQPDLFIKVVSKSTRIARFLSDD